MIVHGSQSKEANCFLRSINLIQYSKLVCGRWLALTN